MGGQLFQVPLPLCRCASAVRLSRKSSRSANAACVVAKADARDGCVRSSTACPCPSPEVTPAFPGRCVLAALCNVRVLRPRRLCVHDTLYLTRRWAQALLAWSSILWAERASHCCAGRLAEE
eukprot:3054846-Rhodomonas_salina.3